MERLLSKEVLLVVALAFETKHRAIMLMKIYDEEEEEEEEPIPTEEQGFVPPDDEDWY